MRRVGIGDAVTAKHPKRPRDPAQLAKLIVDIATGAVQDTDPNAGKGPGRRRHGP